MTKNELLQGTLDMLILKALSRGPLHGYAIARWFERATDDALRVEEGSLYPALYRMEARGWIASKWGVTDRKRNAKFYELTKIGRQQLEAETSSWAHLSSVISRVMQMA
ncbi:MAG TPA: PadR family transcriptional regulator [Blastocatellia bacterium]|nr:PadR family transcriptional regulator [Blastocatellia bacterium]